ncbi:MAG: prepilin-type N-terminal cleavage/methylation domain-containing protein [Fimbriimonadia bacterium]|nr:prepilin-type N-terminal cleavage/methylation domain-containing protein [Fimbriimonadia bacterium]
MRLRQGNSKGFTLVELLVVIAITAILLGLLLGPLVRGFNLTRQGQIQAEAQSLTRLTLEQVSSELKRAAYVYDNSNRYLSIWIATSNGPQEFRLRHAMIDMVSPAYGDPSLDPNDPTSDIPLQVSGNDINLPVSPGHRVIRYFLGLRDNRSQNGVPLSPYFNGFEETMVAADQPDNLCVLYRAEFPVYVKGASGDWELNRELFDTPNDFFDPNFFYGPKADGWRKIAQPVGPTRRIDMLVAQRDNKGNIVDLTSLMQFRPTQITNQTAAPIENENLGDEAGVGTPVQMRFPQGLWTLNPDALRMTLFRSAPDALRRNQALRYYYTDYQNGQWILRYYQQPVNGPEIDRAVCNLSLMRDMVRRNVPPSNAWMMIANNDNQAEPMAFYLNDESGMLDFAIPWWMSYNGNQLTFPVGAQLTPDIDPNPDTRTINGRYNYQFVTVGSDEQNNVKRYISLLDLDNNGVVDNRFDNYLAFFNASIVPGTEIVAGPDQRPGPNFGQPVRYTRVPNNTQLVGPNQYRINYQDIVDEQSLRNSPDPLDFRLLRGYIEFYSDPLTPMPGGANSNVQVQFFYQFNVTGDSVVGDYETRRLMTISLGVRLFGAERPVTYSLNTRLDLPNLIQSRGN